MIDSREIQVNMFLKEKCEFLTTGFGYISEVYACTKKRRFLFMCVVRDGRNQEVLNGCDVLKEFNSLILEIKMISGLLSRKKL